MKKAFLFIIIISLASILSSCGFRDIDKRFFVVAMGIDKSKDEKKPFHVTLKLAIPSAQVAPGKANFQLISKDANSIPEAVRVMKSEVDKEFDFGHCRIILLGPELINHHIGDAMDWLMRRRDIQGISYLGIGKPSPDTVLKARAKSERLPANALILAFDERTNTSPYIVTEILNDFYMRLKETGIDPYLPVITAQKGKYIINTVQLLKDGKLAKELGRDDTRILNELFNSPRRGEIDVSSGKDQFFVNVDDFESKFKVNIPKGKDPYVDVDLNIGGFIEYSDRKINTRSELENFEKKSAQILNKRVKTVLTEIRNSGSDPLGLGLKYQAKTRATKTLDQEWQDIYKDIDFRVHTVFNIRGSGTMY
ncbi:Ger(x)C family spore germination protein [Peribacillus sp. SCS-155]|uniref:Ger(x)C family spore germination protein n=1 Tax=Peribacillus sedimenti TaxID=3115297 RepID=UPI0039059588